MPVIVKREVGAAAESLNTAAAFDVDFVTLYPMIASTSIHEAIPEGTAYCGTFNNIVPEIPLVFLFDSALNMDELDAEKEDSLAIVDQAPFSNSSEAALTLTAADWADDVLRSILEEVSENRRLPVNWDRYGGLPTTSKVAEKAEVILLRTTRLAVRLGIEPSVGPLADGGMDIGWISPSGNELLLEVPPEADYLNYVHSRKLADGSFLYRNGRLDGPQDVSALIKELA